MKRLLATLIFAGSVVSLSLGVKALEAEERASGESATEAAAAAPRLVKQWKRGDVVTPDDPLLTLMAGHQERSQAAYKAMTFEQTTVIERYKPRNRLWEKEKVSDHRELAARYEPDGRGELRPTLIRDSDQKAWAKYQKKHGQRLAKEKELQEARKELKAEYDQTLRDLMEDYHRDVQELKALHESQSQEAPGGGDSLVASGNAPGDYENELEERRAEYHNDLRELKEDYDKELRELSQDFEKWRENRKDKDSLAKQLISPILFPMTTENVRACKFTVLLATSDMLLLRFEPMDVHREPIFEGQVFVNSRTGEIYRLEIDHLWNFEKVNSKFKYLKQFHVAVDYLEQPGGYRFPSSMQGRGYAKVWFVKGYFRFDVTETGYAREAEAERAGSAALAAPRAVDDKP